jgi:hypothetical protein
MEPCPLFSFEALPLEVQDHMLYYLSEDKKDVGSLLCVSKTIKALFIARLTIDNKQFANSYLNGNIPAISTLSGFENIKNKTTITLNVLKESDQLEPEDMFHMQKMMRCLSKASEDLSAKLENSNGELRELLRLQV